MSDPTAEDKPLDAAQLRLQARLQKMLMWSAAIMVLGLVAVFAAIFYRVNRAEPRIGLDPSRPVVETLPLPEGGRVVDSRLEGERMLVTIETPRGASLLVIDLATMKAVRRLDFARP